MTRRSVEAVQRVDEFAETGPVGAVEPEADRRDRAGRVGSRDQRVPGPARRARRWVVMASETPLDRPHGAMGAAGAPRPSATATHPRGRRDPSVPAGEQMCPCGSRLDDGRHRVSEADRGMAQDAQPPRGHHCPGRPTDLLAPFTVTARRSDVGGTAPDGQSGDDTTPGAEVAHTPRTGGRPRGLVVSDHH